MKQRSKLRTLFQNELQGVNVVSAREFRTKTTILFVDQDCEVSFDMFFDDFSFYLCNGKEKANTPSIFVIKTNAVFS